MRKHFAVAILGILSGLAAGWLLHQLVAQDLQSRSSVRLRTAERAADPPAAQGTAENIVAVDASSVKRMDLELTLLTSARHAPQARTTAIVLSPSGLAQLATTYATDAKDLATARASLTVAQKEYERQSVLYKANQTTSLKAFQAARGMLQTSQAQTSAAERQLQLDALAVEQQWGPVLSEWFVARTPTFEKILSQQEELVQVSLGARDPRTSPDTVRLTAPSGIVVGGRFVSSLPQTNPVIQGSNFLYLIRARPSFAPGLSLLAELRAGPARTGVVVPAAAIVWSAGQAWAYKELAPNRFERFPVATDEPVTDGWFVTTEFVPGDRVVIRGAEELFSAETQPSSGAGEKGEGDED
ncbi:MAG TPA: hypothetical protein VKS20_08545 [Candidatus Acidoferrales bacterium]|nr:hypothetical protein [Candidatus Acidoferrales bacterium]